MKVKDLIFHLQELGQEGNTRIFTHKNGRPLCDTKPIQPTALTMLSIKILFT